MNNKIFTSRVLSAVIASFFSLPSVASGVDNPSLNPELFAEQPQVHCVLFSNWIPGNTYVKGSFVRHDGNYFSALTDNNYEPAEGDDWQKEVCISLESNPKADGESFDDGADEAQLDENDDPKISPLTSAPPVIDVEFDPPFINEYRDMLNTVKLLDSGDNEKIAQGLSSFFTGMTKESVPYVNVYANYGQTEFPGQFFLSLAISPRNGASFKNGLPFMQAAANDIRVRTQCEMLTKRGYWNPNPLFTPEQCTRASTPEHPTIWASGTYKGVNSTNGRCENRTAAGVQYPSFDKLQCEQAGLNAEVRGLSDEFRWIPYLPMVTSGPDGQGYGYTLNYGEDHVFATYDPRISGVVTSFVAPPDASITLYTKGSIEGDSQTLKGSLEPVAVPSAFRNFKSYRMNNKGSSVFFSPGTVIRIKKSTSSFQSNVLVVYTDKNGKYHSTGDVRFWGTWTYVVPEGSTNIKTAVNYHTGLVWAPTKVIFKQEINVKNACFEIWGTSIRPYWKSVPSCSF